jgi:signal transduction histidine kinase
VVDTTAVGPAQVAGNRAELTRAIGNVIDNAARHAGRVVQLAVAEQDGAALVVVTDDGPGIPEEQRERVFDRFTRLDEARTAGTGGAGLGLAIARDIVVRHGGSIEIDPAHPAGARVVITLPR